MARFTRRQLLQAMAVAAAAPALARAAGRLGGDAEYFEVTRVELPVAGLDPAHDGLTVAQLSDLHVGSGVPDGRVIAAVRAVNAARPDLVALTGDFVTTRRDPVPRVGELLSALAPPAVAVLGNHDHWTHPAEVRRVLEHLGVAVLQNRHTVVRLRGAPLTVVGVDDATARQEDVPAAFAGVRGGALVLAHSPATAGRLPDAEGVVCLSGHTHGGQWDVPGLTAGVFRTVGEPWYRGRYGVRGNALYVNRGLGFGRGTRLPRIHSDPEVTLITLRRAAA